MGGSKRRKRTRRTTRMKMGPNDVKTKVRRGRAKEMGGGLLRSRKDGELMFLLKRLPDVKRVCLHN